MPKEIKALIGHEGVTREVSYEVPDNEPGMWDSNYDFSIIGKKDLTRLDAIEKVTGKAKYAHDMRRPNMLYAVLVTCPFAHARINKVDTSEAEKMPGVKAVMVADGLNTARFAGWIIGAVAAETIQQARDAARKVKVDYTELPFVVDEEEAMREESPRVHKGGNVDKGRVRDRGDVDKGFQEADVIHEGEYETQVTPHNCLETHGCVAEWNGDELTVWHSTQGIMSVQGAVSKAAGIPASQTRVITQYMGGGFGSKFGPEEFGNMAVSMAKETKRPVHFLVDRYVDTVMCGNKPGSKMYVKLGAKRDGTLTAVYLKADNFIGHTGRASVAAPYLEYYECENIRIEESNVRTNAGSSRAFRAPGHPQGSFGMEMALNELAAKLEMDPLALRLKNVPETELDARQYEFKLGAEKFDWKNKYKKDGSSEGRIKRGVGCAVTFWPYTGRSGGAEVRCTLYPDGSAEVANCTQDLGTGHRTMMAAVAAETLGVGIENIKVSIGDTRLGLNGPASGGSTTTPTVSPAVRSAAYKAKRKLFELVAGKWKTDVDDIECKNGTVYSKSDSNKKMSWKKAAAMIRKGNIVTMGEHINRPNIEDLNIGTPARGAQFAEVEVDTETGKVCCTKLVAVQDVGKTLTKTQSDSQICGAVIQGLSYALLEDRIMDNMLGRQINPNMEDYKILGIQEMPDIEPVIVDVYDPVNNTSAKGLGEPPHIPTAAAVGCAVANALGMPIRSLPITPDKVLDALNRKEG